MAAPKPGVYENIPFAEYLSWSDAMDKTNLAEFADNPGKFLWRQQNKIFKSSTSLSLGTAIDTIVFDGEEEFHQRFAIRPMDLDGRTKAGKEWMAEYGDLKQLTFDQGEAVLGAARAIKAYPPAALYLNSGRSQLSIVWEDADTGLLCKARPDWVPDGMKVLFDLKSAEAASPDEFARVGRRFKYHWQAAMYMNGWEAVTGEHIEKFVFGVVEPEPPHGCEVYSLAQQDVALGRLEYKEALKFYKECRDRGDFPLSSGKETEISFSDFERKI